MEKDILKNLIIMINYYSKEKFYMEKEMEKEKNIILMAIYYLKENI